MRPGWRIQHGPNTGPTKPRPVRDTIVGMSAVPSVLGLHRPPSRLRPRPRGDALPALAGAIAAAVGTVNVSGALAEIPAQLNGLLFSVHALELQAGVALL